ncbi:MAG TPA: right-handed parallel beta-helix repeat-containing protein [Solirubrobacterales bacterium]|nr:right-handed parallel beta-helix repeat-containing protein [Solirubrobacterales bacterium]
MPLAPRGVVSSALLALLLLLVAAALVTADEPAAGAAPAAAWQGPAAGHGLRLRAVPKYPTDLGCAQGSAKVSSADGLHDALTAHRDACVIAPVGDVEIENLGDLSGVIVSSEGSGSLGAIDLEDTTGLTIRGARFRSIEIRQADDTKLFGNKIGGTPSHRVYDQLIFMPERSDDVTIQGNDIGWTLADNSGNTGYGCRCYGETNGLRFIGNRVHDIAADGFQGTEGANVLIARNDIGPVGANPGSDEHSDDIQMVSNGPGLRIVDNWIHNQGYFGGHLANNSGSLYVHGGTGNPVLVENNLITENQGVTEICGLGTGGTTRSNITIRLNTWIQGGLAYPNFPGFQWDCDGGSGNRIERNVAIDSDGGYSTDDGGGSAADFSENIWTYTGKLKFDEHGNCLSARCNPKTGPIGFRSPPGTNFQP